jgi:hypothetical protein
VWRLAAASLLLAVSGASAASPGREKVTGGWVEALAMDGPRVAYAVASDTSFCHKLLVWNLTTDSDLLVSGPRAGTCGSDEPHGQTIREVALAGSRVAWIRAVTGNTEADDYLYTAALGGSERRLRAAVRRGDTFSALAGRWIGGLVGSGSLLSVDTWTTSAAGAVTHAALELVTAHGLSTLASGPGTVLTRATDGQRIAVLRSDGTVAVYARSGRLLLTLSPGSTRDLALDEGRLVVLTKARTIEVFDAGTGKLLRGWPVPAGAAHLDVAGDLAVYSVWRAVHALRLSTGEDAVLAGAPRAIAGLEIGAPGVVYAFNTVKGTRDLGTLVFVPLSRVSAAVS